MTQAATDELQQAKRALREEMRLRCRALGADEALRAGASAARIVETLAHGDALALTEGACVSLFASLPGEIDTIPIEAALRRLRARIAWPRIEGAELSLRLAHRAQLVPTGRLAIPEPSPSAPSVAPDEIHAYFVPGLAFDASGGRLGHGRAYYDRLLRRAPHALRVGLALPWQVVARVPVEPHDCALDFVLVGAPFAHGVLLETRARALSRAAGPVSEDKEPH